MAVSLKKGKKAPSSVKAPRTTSGGTQAPASAARGPKAGVGSGHPFRQGVSAGKPLGTGAGGGAAAAGSPAAPGALPPPETSQRLRERDEEKYGYNEAERAHNYGLYQAALKYGDPAVIALYGEAQDPDIGALQQITKQEKAAQKQNVLGHNANNTFFSGMNLDDIALIGTQARDDRSRALQEFQAAKQELDDAWNRAIAEHRWKGEGFDEAAQGEFNETEPTAQAGGGGSAGGGGGNKNKGGGGSSKGGGGNKGGGNKSKGGSTGKSGGTNAPASKNNNTSQVSQNQALKKKKK